MVKLLKAKKAKKIAQKARERKEIDDTLREIASEIDKAARRGEFNLEYEYTPGSRDFVVLDLKLKRAGYKLKRGKGVFDGDVEWMRISWK